MPVRRYFTAIVLLCLVALPALLAVKFIIDTHVAELKIAEQLEVAKCCTCSFSKQQIQWVKKGKELLVNGKLFDVKKFTESTDSLTVTGLFDNEEDALQEKYAALIGGKQQHPPAQVFLLKIFFTPFITDPGIENEGPAFTPLATTIHHFFSEGAIAADDCIVTPPPQLLTVA